MLQETMSLDRSRRTSSRGLQARLSSGVLGLGVAGSALAVGAVHTVTLCIVTTVLAAAAVLGWWRAEPISARRGATVLLATGLALTLYTAIQCLPLPIAWLSVIAPHNADVWTRALSPLRESGPRWAPISLDPIATRVEVLKGVAYLLAFVTALRLARTRHGVAFLSATLVISGVALALAALIHPAFGAHKLYGIYEPGPGIAERHIAPLMNPNNLAGYLNIAFCLVLAAALEPEPRVPRPISGAIALLLGATQVWVASRGGVVAMALGAVVVVSVVYLARGRQRGAVAWLSIASAVAAAAGAVMVGLGGSEETSSELFNGDTSKFGMFMHVMRMLPAVPWFGCGRGAFESAYPAFRDFGSGYVTFAYPENVVAQWLLEWGAVVGVLAIVTVGIALRPKAVLARSTTAAGAWAALFAVAIQNLGDLGTEVPGLMLACVLCAAVVVGGSRGRGICSRLELWSRYPRWVAWIAGFASVCAVGWGAGAIGKSLSEDRRALHDAAVGSTGTADAIHALARTSMLRHPAEPYIPFAVALRAELRDDDPSLPWLAATLERAKVYGPAHLLLARRLARVSPAQARMEYRLFDEQSPELAWIGLQESVRLVWSFDDAMELVPSGRVGITVLDAVSQSVALRLPATRVRLDAEILARRPTDALALARWARDAVEDVDPNQPAPWCVGPQPRVDCVQNAKSRVARVRSAEAGKCEPYALDARLRIAEGDEGRALDLLDKAADAVEDRVACLEQLAELATAARDTQRAEGALQKVVNAGCSGDADCARNLTWVAEQEEARGNARKALALYKRALERTPEDDALLEKCARLAARLGLHAEAARAYDALLRNNPENRQFQKAAEIEKSEALQSAPSL